MRGDEVTNQNVESGRIFNLELRLIYGTLKWLLNDDFKILLKASEHVDFSCYLSLQYIPN